jgi:integrase
MRRGARYYLRVRVPLDLIDIIGRQEIWQSLGTADHREAVRRYFPARTELQQRFEHARRRRAGLSNDEARRLASDWLQATDRRAASLDFGLLGRDRRLAIAETERGLFDLIEGADGESVQAALDHVLISAGWPARQHVVGSIRTRRLVADVDPAETAELHHLIRRGLIELARRRLDRLNGRPSAGLDPVFVQPVSSADGPGGLTLDELAKRFLAERAPAMLSKTMTEYEALARVLKEVWGEHHPVREITRAHCRQIRDLFAALPSNWTKRFPRLTTMQAAEHAKANGIEPMDPTTANKHIGRMSSMLRWAEREDFITRNPAAGLKVAKPQTDARDARRPFSIDQLRLIFDAPLYRDHQADRAGHFWIPLICLFAGLRMGEACQLRIDDIETEHGIHVIQVRPDQDTGTRLKTRHSRRTVPIHPELVRIGLLDHAQAMRAAGHDRLFPELPRDRRGSYSGHFQRWANRFLDRAGAKGERQSFHSLRHTSTDALRRAEATGEVIDGILRWSRGNMRDRYGSGPWIMMLAEVMQRLSYPGLDLSHLG